MKALAKHFSLLSDRMPRKVALSAVAAVSTLVIFVALFFTLGAAHDQSIEANSRLKGELDQVTRKARQSKEDRQFIVENQERYEALVNGDRLIPHTRAVAMTQMATLAKQNGLTTLSYNFTAAQSRSATAAAAQPVTGGYRVQVEQVDLKLGAPLDTEVFDFLADLGSNFPGSAVVEQFTLERSGDITTEALNQVSRGREAGLVRGEIRFTWRTAQAEDKKGGNAPKAGK